MAKKDTTFLMVDNFFKAEQLSFFSDMNIIPDHVIKDVISCGTGEKTCRPLIHFLYQKENDPEKRIRFLKKIYHVSYKRQTGHGCGFNIDGTDYATWVNAAGISIATGRRVQFTDKGTLISWAEIDGYLLDLIKSGDYIEKGEIQMAQSYYEKFVADNLFSLLQDVGDDAKSKHLQLLVETRSTAEGGYEGFCKALYVLFRSKDSVRQLITEMNAFSLEVKENPNLMRFHFYDSGYTAWLLSLLTAESISFIEKNEIKECIPAFITDDEIINHFVTIYPSESKYSLYIEFAEHKTNAERAKYLQKIGGVCGGSCITGHYSCDAKGITFEKLNSATIYAKESFSWQHISNLISSVMSDNRYLTAEDRDEYGDYVKKRLYMKVKNFFFEFRNREHPEFDENYANTDAIKGIINNKERCLHLLKVCEETLEQIDKDYFRYKSYKETVDALKQYVAGTFLVFEGLPVVSPA